MDKVRSFLAASLLVALATSCQTAGVVQVSVPPTTGAEPPVVEHRVYDHEHIETSSLQSSIFVWPFLYGEDDWKVTITDLGVLHLGLWSEEKDTANDAALATGSVKAWLMSAHGYGFQLIDSPEQYPSDSPLATARSLGATQLVVGSCQPGTTSMDYVIQMQLYDVTGSTEVVSAVIDTCSGCRTQELQDMAERLAKDLFLHPRGLQLPGDI